MTKKEAYWAIKLRHQSHSLTFFLKKQSHPSATSVLSKQPNPGVYTPTAFLDKLTFADYVESEKSQDYFG